MDQFEKKLFCQLDDDSPAVAEKARSAYAKSLKAKSRTCRDEMHDIEQGEAAEKNYAELDTKYQEAMQHNAQWAQRFQPMQQQVAQLQQENAALKRRLTVFKSVTWVRLNRTKAALCAALLVAAVFGYRYYAAVPWPDAADAGLRAVAQNAKWGEWFNKPFVASVGNKPPLWVMLRGEINDLSFSDKDGRAVVMRCLHVFAVPAEPDSGEFRRVDPYSFFGWVRWPERLVQCQPAPDQKEAQR